jgi:hypothetical protein
MAEQRAPGVSRSRAGARMKQAGPLPNSQGEAQRPLIGTLGGASRFAGEGFTNPVRSVRSRLAPPTLLAEPIAVTSSDRPLGSKPWDWPPEL